MYSSYRSKKCENDVVSLTVSRHESPAKERNGTARYGRLGDEMENSFQMM